MSSGPSGLNQISCTLPPVETLPTNTPIRFSVVNPLGYVNAPLSPTRFPGYAIPSFTLLASKADLVGVSAASWNFPLNTAGAGTGGAWDPTGAPGSFPGSGVLALDGTPSNVGFSLTNPLGSSAPRLGFSGPALTTLIWPFTLRIHTFRPFDLSNGQSSTFLWGTSVGDGTSPHDFHIGLFLDGSTLSAFVTQRVVASNIIYAQCIASNIGSVAVSTWVSVVMMADSERDFSFAIDDFISSPVQCLPFNAPDLIVPSTIAFADLSPNFLPIIRPFVRNPTMSVSAMQFFARKLMPAEVAVMQTDHPANIFPITFFLSDPPAFISPDADASFLINPALLFGRGEPALGVSLAITCLGCTLQTASPIAWTADALPKRVVIRALGSALTAKVTFAVVGPP